MREIKFRAWDGKCYTPDFFITSEGTVFKPHYDRDAEIVSGFTIEQFTGLHDKNGKEIYEGDRVKVVIIWNELNRDIKREFISSIVFCEHRGCYIFPNHSNVSLDDARQDDEMISLEVIGNIHESPELLEGRE